MIDIFTCLWLLTRQYGENFHDNFFCFFLSRGGRAGEIISWVNMIIIWQQRSVGGCGGKEREVAITSILLTYMDQRIPRLYKRETLVELSTGRTQGPEQRKPFEGFPFI